MKNFHIITIFPKMFDSYLNEGVLGRAIHKKKEIKIKFYNPRDFTKDKHKRVDNIPYGGGPGMVMMAEPILKAWEKAKGKNKKIKTIIFSPRGKVLTNSIAQELVKKYTDIILISGRYEGIDERVKKITKAEEVSVGPYILTGGELPAMIFMDVLSRQISGILGNPESLEENRDSGISYTRPEVLKFKKKNYKVPRVLLSGHHQKINEWRKKGSA